jgi:hypothetical protein
MSNSKAAARTLIKSPADDETSPSSPRRVPQVIKAEIDSGALKLTLDLDQAAEIDAAFGSTSGAFQAYAQGHLLNILQTTPGEDRTFVMNASLAMLSGIGPQNEMEAMLAAQMVATHHLAMRQLNKHAYADSLHLHEAHGNMAAKLLRTFTMQMEALARLRRGGKQIVEHVHIGAGGQAVIAGTVNTGTQGG